MVFDSFVSGGRRSKAAARKAIPALFLSIMIAGELGVHAQGTVTFAETADATILIYSVGSAVEVTGNSPADTPAGTTTYTGIPIGGWDFGAFQLYYNSFEGGWGNGNEFTAQLYGAAGTYETRFSELSPLTQYTSTFSTKVAGAGQFLGSSPASDPGIPGATGKTGATLALAVWYNDNGTLQTLSAAQNAFVAWGTSPLFSLAGPLGGQGTPPTPPPNLTGLQSFSLNKFGDIWQTPEPGTAALIMAGAIVLHVVRRK
jgi:hypothetical protein